MTLATDRAIEFANRGNDMPAAKNKPFSGPTEVTQAEWNRIFGKPDKRKPGRHVLVDGKLVHEDELPAPDVVDVTAIHGDRVYTKLFDYGAGRKWNSRTERREWMKAKNRECIG
jgi:hypothetical protein